MTPALPWTDEVEGGDIQLAASIQFEDLRNGNLKFTLGLNGEEITPITAESSLGFVIKEPTNSQIIYYIEEFEGRTRTIHLVRESSAPQGYYLNSVERLLYVTPDLPWSGDTESGIVHLTNSKTWSELLNNSNSLVFTLSNGENTKNTNLHLDTNDGHLYIGQMLGATWTYFYEVVNFNGDTSESISDIQLEITTGSTNEWALSTIYIDSE